MEPSALKSVPASDAEADEEEEVNTAKESTVTDYNLSPSDETETGSKMTRDPLDWFGILIPPALRTSQGNFKDAVSGLLPALASISKEMREVEIEVRRARKRLRKAV